MKGNLVYNNTFTCLLLSLTLTSYARSNDESTTTTSQVAVITLSEKAELTRSMVGIVFAIQKQTLSSQVAGTITSASMAMGQSVAKGDVIALLDNRDAKAKLDLVQAELQIAGIRVKQKEIQFSRVEKTYRKNLSSSAVFDQARLEFLLAQREYEVYLAKTTLVELNLDKHRIIAPFGGFLVGRSPVIGKQVLPGDKIVELQNNRQLRLKVLVSQQELDLLNRTGAQIVMQVAPTMPLELAAVSPSIIGDSGMIEIELSLPAQASATAFKGSNGSGIESNQVLKQSHSASGRFMSGQAIALNLIQPRLSVPGRAIAMDEHGEYVFVVANGKAVRLAVDDLHAGQQLVVLGGADLSPGDSIKVLPVGEVL